MVSAVSTVPIQREASSVPVSRDITYWAQIKRRAGQ